MNRKFQLVLNENVPVGQVGHGSSTAMLDESTTFITVGRGRPHILCANHHQIQVLTEPLCLAQAILNALPNNERGTKYRGLTYSARQKCP